MSKTARGDATKRLLTTLALTRNQLPSLDTVIHSPILAQLHGKAPGKPLTTDEIKAATKALQRRFENGELGQVIRPKAKSFELGIRIDLDLDPQTAYPKASADVFTFLRDELMDRTAEWMQQHLGDSSRSGYLPCFVANALMFGTTLSLTMFFRKGDLYTKFKNKVLIPTKGLRNIDERMLTDHSGFLP